MRISSCENDPGYRAWKRLPKNVTAIVRVDGKFVTGCYTADTKRGYALAAATDETGNILLNTKGDQVRLKQIRGRVTIDIVGRK